MAQIGNAVGKLCLKKDQMFCVFEFIWKLSFSVRCIRSDKQTVVFIMYKFIIDNFIFHVFSESITTKSQRCVVGRLLTSAGPYFVAVIVDTDTPIAMPSYPGNHLTLRSEK